MIEGWTETCRSVVSPWECDVTEHFTIAYYFDRLADAAATIEESLGCADVARSARRRFDVRFVRELRAGASFHIVSAPIGLDEGSRSSRPSNPRLRKRGGHRLGRADPRSSDRAVAGRYLRAQSSGGWCRWEGPEFERRPEPRNGRRVHSDGSRPGQAGGSGCGRQILARRVRSPLHRRLSSKRWPRSAPPRPICSRSAEATRPSSWRCG